MGDGNETRRDRLRSLFAGEEAPRPGAPWVPAEFPEVQALREREAELEARGPLDQLYFHEAAGHGGAYAEVAGGRMRNFASYDYLGLAGHPEVAEAAAEAARRYGTSASSSRILTGSRPVHRELESELAAALGAESALTFVGGHATNVTTIGHLFGPEDLVLHDVYIHNSVLEGIRLAGARRLAFPHNDLDALEAQLKRHREGARRVLVVVEGAYSMDGDFPDLPRLVAMRSRYRFALMVDEAHSFGVLGETGRGISELEGVAPEDVDIWMGTLSKSLGSCGGFVAGPADLIRYLRYTAPGFIFTAAMTPPNAAAALAALRIMLREPERVTTLRERAERLVNGCRDIGLDVGTSAGTAIVPVILGASDRTLRWARALYAEGFLAAPVLFPAVPEEHTRLRLFVSRDHEAADIDALLEALARLHREDPRTDQA